MKQILFILVLFSFVFTGCKGQSTEQTNSKDTSNISSVKPKTDIKVNKEYDADGNLIRFDSTYSYFYSNIENDTNLRDSIFNSFIKEFDENLNFPTDPFFKNLFFQDSLLKYDFYKNNFFEKRFKDNQNHFNSLFLEMDSLKNLFFKDQFKEPN